MKRLRSELVFLIAQWKANFASAMEYRAAFISQIVGMFVNDIVFILFWVVFFDRFKQVRGWGVGDILLLNAVVGTGYGLAFTFFGNALQLSRVIAQGQLDAFREQGVAARDHRPESAVHRIVRSFPGLGEPALGKHRQPGPGEPLQGVEDLAPGRRPGIRRTGPSRGASGKEDRYQEKKQQVFHGVVVRS